MFAPQSGSDMARFPNDILMLILGKVPLCARISSCNRVCKEWRTTAVAATDSMQLNRYTAPESLQLYLKQHGQHLNSFSLRMLDEQQLMHLPCSRLQELHLHGGELQPAVLHASAATLTKLVLESYVLLPAAGSLGSEEVFLQQVDSSSTGQYIGDSVWDHPPFINSHESGSAADAGPYSDESPGSPMHLSPLAQQFHNALIQLSNLQHLELQDHGDSCNDSSSKFGSALPHLTALTHLKIWWWCLNPDTWRQNLSCLTALRVLHLDNPDEEDAVTEHVLDGVQHLQLLTALRLKGLAIRISQHSNSTLGRLTGLQELDLDYSSCDLSALSAITGLRSLALTLEDPQPDYLWYTTQGDVEVAAVDKHQLQATLLRLQHLTCFSIGGRDPPHDAFWDLPVPPYRWELDMAASVSSSEDKAETDFLPAESAALPSMEVFKAFTASSCLQHMDLSKAAMQFHTWKYLFPAGHQALQLTHLQAPYALYDPRDGDESYKACAVWPWGQDLSEEDVQAMVRCCPNLQALEAYNVLHFTPELGPLQQLTCLEAKWGGDYFSTCDDGCRERVSGVDKAAAARALAGLTNLRYLGLLDSKHLGVELCTALLQLTGLVWLGLGMQKAAAGALSDAEAGLLARLTGLSALSVAGCSLTDEQLLQLAALPQLWSLQVSNHGLGPLFKACVADSIDTKGCEAPHGVLCQLVKDINQHYLQNLQQHNSKQTQAAARLTAASAQQQWLQQQWLQQQWLQQQLHALQHQYQHLQQQLVEAVAMVGRQQHNMVKVFHLLAQQKEQLNDALQKLVIAGQINMQQGQHWTRQQQHNSQLQQLCNQQQVAAQQQAQQLQHLQQQHQAMLRDLQQQLLHKDALLAQQQRELDQLRQWAEAPQQHYQQTHYPLEIAGDFWPVYSWQPTSQELRVGYQRHHSGVHQQQWQQQQQQEQQW